jgi:hypothetical protein
MLHRVHQLTLDFVSLHHAPNSGEFPTASLHQKRSLFTLELTPGLWFVYLKVSAVRGLGSQFLISAAPDGRSADHDS